MYRPSSFATPFPKTYGAIFSLLIFAIATSTGSALVYGEKCSGCALKNKKKFVGASGKALCAAWAALNASRQPRAQRR